MTRNARIICLVAVSALVVVLVARSVSGASGGPTAIPGLAAGIHQQARATEAALELANDPWIARVAGLGVGLTVGLVAGGVGTYVNRDETR